MSYLRIRHFVVTALVISCALVADAAGGAPQGDGGAATLKFRAFVADGNPAPDLKAADLALKVDGKPREILSLQFVDLRPGEGAAKPAAEPPFATNAASAKGRDVYILVDEESIAPSREGAVKEAAKHIVSALGSGDRAALMSVRQGGPNVGLTADHSLVAKAITSLAGYGNPQESATDLTCRTVRTVQALQAVFSGAGAAAPPTVVFFSTGVAALQTDIVLKGSGANAPALDTPIGDLCELRVQDFQRLGATAQNAGANFYAVELLEASATQPLPQSRGGLENLAGVTSGDMLRVGANVEAQMARIASSMSSYYLAAFTPESSDRSGGTKRIELASTRGGVTLKAPREMTFAKAGGKRAGPRDMIRVATPFTDLPLRAAAYASRNPGDGKVRVLTLFEPLEGDTKLNAATVAMYDKAGKLTAQWNGQSGDFAGPTTIAALLADPGEYRLRVAATDASGRSGAVDLQISAALIEAGPIHLGDLVLGKMGDKGPVPVMQFEGEAEALAMIELYGRPTGPLKMYVEVLNPGGQPVQVPLTPAATNEADKFVLSARLPIASLQPGDYTVRAIVGVEGHQDGQVTTTMRKAKAGS